MDNPMGKGDASPPRQLQKSTHPSDIAMSKRKNASRGQAGASFENPFDSYDIIADFFAAVDQRDTAKALRTLKVSNKAAKDPTAEAKLLAKLQALSQKLNDFVGSRVPQSANQNVLQNVNSFGGIPADVNGSGYAGRRSADEPYVKLDDELNKLISSDRSVPVPQLSLKIDDLLKSEWDKIPTDAVSGRPMRQVAGADGTTQRTTDANHKIIADVCKVVDPRASEEQIRQYWENIQKVAGKSKAIPKIVSPPQNRSATFIPRPRRGTPRTIDLSFITPGVDVDSSRLQRPAAWDNDVYEHDEDCGFEVRVASEAELLQEFYDETKAIYNSAMQLRGVPVDKINSEFEKMDAEINAVKEEIHISDDCLEPKNADDRMIDDELGKVIGSPEGSPSMDQPASKGCGNTLLGMLTNTNKKKDAAMLSDQDRISLLDRPKTEKSESLPEFGASRNGTERDSSPAFGSSTNANSNAVDQQTSKGESHKIIEPDLENAVTPEVQAAIIRSGSANLSSAAAAKGLSPCFGGRNADETAPHFGGAVGSQDGIDMAVEIPKKAQKQLDRNCKMRELMTKQQSEISRMLDAVGTDNWWPSRRIVDQFGFLASCKADGTQGKAVLRNPILHPQSCQHYPRQEKMGRDSIIESFPLNVFFERGKTGFEMQHHLDLNKHDVIAGRYMVVDFFGSGQFSRAVQCYDHFTKTMVCMKVIRPTKEFIDQSLDEIKLLRLLNANGDCDDHHVLKLFDFFYYKEHLILVTEVLQDNLYEFSKHDRELHDPASDVIPDLDGGETIPWFSLGRIQIITQQILKALAFIHSLDLVHCDLKPENILFKSYTDVEIKVIDFGTQF